MAAPAALALIGLVVGGVAPGAWAATGGATTRSHANGGAAFGATVPVPAKRPQVRWLTVSPRTVVAGSALPRLRFRIRQRGMQRVRARIVVLRLPRNAPVARISLGWVRTGRKITARWPAGVALRRGRYLVRLHVKDSRGHVLRRTAASPGRARILVRAAPVARPAIPPPPLAFPAPAAAR